ncbi:MAG: universal stress protein [Nitrospirae bacterium]|nr:universal stress protein [Candidatus Manganitrophaceae bacterium]
MSVKKVLIPTDFSELSNEAIDAALPMVKQFGAEVCFLHVIDRLDHPDDMTALFDEGYAYMMDRAHALLNDLVIRSAQAEITAKFEIANGTPYLEILRMAKKMGSDLIMMGTHGRKGVDHMLMGSQAERVVRMAVCPVTTIKTRKTSS